MPHKEFLETYPLYRKFKVDKIPYSLDSLPKVAIKMDCPVCKSDQTFVMKNEYWENYHYSNVPVGGLVIRTEYLCTHCEKFNRYFFVQIDPKKTFLMKVGQYPAWEIHGEPNVEKLLGQHSGYFKKGLICESQGYGIAAFAYYRRIVEEIIDELLEEITDLISGQDQSEYLVALEKTKKTIVAQEKIALVKDMLPPILRPDGMNPLSVLHSTLSEGLHSKPDDECLEVAMAAREILVFLVNQVAASKASSKSFTESMRKFLNKKS